MENRQVLTIDKKYYRDRIAEMVGEIENIDILEYIYKITADIAKEDKPNAEITD